ncbi:MAG: 50S ribosomal protein L27 [Candidatus Woesebacteria bacterium GW2011_GWB1_43_14]|uniref:Large ribosomal subunit protein bL27 n=1 Tax=Candidatus Woesebacteria bacterium GW2011_GWB1_43_14 TaxID=1618578 RepID=A0A0G1DHV3_9BACT|nr:MAG: 50S ribosomal protein L27 [Candidatus Woesebacteria bacterium GW2011_GWA1_39_11b]KKS78447.1 MAG: 50S ribosomal protein L27 [Candidatus Woesebacteria bacterium GW2011_GWC1_42_9]KKS97137.1 MAG: 50S ribosomal protein L27 [Candidatus Woesebacteria bacterium GW2011_GWB1_43_14]
MSKKKQAGKLKQHVRPAGKRLGLKVAHGEKVVTGSILARQRGTKFSPGEGVRVGRDHTLYAVVSGQVNFKKRQGKGIISIM